MRIFPCLAALVLALLPRASPAGADAHIGAGIPPSPFGAGSSIAAASDASASSDRAAYITGQVIGIDGGMSL